jgi:hypothetical protein
MTLMSGEAPLWTEIEAALSRFDGTEARQAELRELTSRMPRSIEEVPAAFRARAHELGAEALYQAGYPERAVAWATPPTDGCSALWLGHARFDLGEYQAALPCFRMALAEAPLQNWARAKVKELVLCCEIVIDPQRVLRESIGHLHDEYELLGVDAPMALELERTINSGARDDRLDADLAEHVRRVFAREFEEIRHLRALNASTTPL